MVYKISWESGWLPWQPNLGQKIALISSLQEIWKFIACTMGISGLLNFNTLSEFLREPRGLPWQLNLKKKSQNCTDFSSAQEIEDFFARIVRFSANSNMLSKISREPRELPWQPNLGKNEPKLHRFQFCARNRGIYHMIKKFSGSANSNMVYKISWESGRLPWQPNLGKKCTHQFSASNRKIFRTYSWDFGTGESQYAIIIFKGAKRVIMATKF